MSVWFWSLVLKPFVGLAMLAAIYYLPRYPAQLIYWLLPKCRLRDILFDGWEHGGLVRGIRKRDPGNR